ncbi:MAG: glycosyltransferase family 2 protein [Deinococcota bacterium]
MTYPLNIGLLMTYNIADMIDEMMDANRHAVDAIFVLDGSTDGTAEKLAAYSEVKHIFHDDEVVTPPERVRDYHRQVLLEAAQSTYGHGHWYTLMHGDEIFYDNPREVIAAAERQGASRVNWAAMQFFLHTSDEATWSKKAHLGVQDRLRWYSPFWVEIRQFKASAKTHYPKGQHGKVIPASVGWRPYSKMPIFKHYTYRSPQQVQQRTQQQGMPGTTSLSSGIYRDRYAPEYREARYFSGDFGEFEDANLLTMLWRWRRLVKR